MLIFFLDPVVKPRGNTVGFINRPLSKLVI
ncbi:MAG: hypothetical protein ACEY3D_01990 [Rickettsia sp.]